ncbi:MAG: glycerol-3-phosphate 1-O-acyltransferase PlsY [Oscillospiraceae bacterium]
MIDIQFLIAFIVTSLACYLIGSLNSAVIVSKLYAKDDIRNHGSGNAGMTNILRTYGKIPAVFTALGDFFKGVAAVLLGRIIFEFFAITILDGGYVGALFVIIGHLYPVFFNFKGGKGVLTSFGALLIVNPLVFAIIGVVMIPFVFIVKIVSLTSIIGAIAYPFLTYFTLMFTGKPYKLASVFACLFSFIIIYMHRENIKRLLDGTEHRFGKNSKV